MICEQHLGFEFDKTNASTILATVCVNGPLVEALYSEISTYYQKSIHAPGFPIGTVPLQYIERNYRSSLLTHIQNFLLPFCITQFVTQQLRKQGTITLSDPVLIDSSIEPSQGACFRFSCITIPLSITSDWRHSAFRAPPRKNYRDLDNQVLTFLSEEEQLSEQIGSIEPNDWIGFLARPLKKCLEPLFAQTHTFLWMKLGSEEADREAQEIFFKHQKSESIVSSARFLQDYFHAQYHTQYLFALEILYHSPHKLFCFESFKKQFKLKSTKDVHRKLIEVFSFRHDISQRRETVETAFKALFKAIPFSVPQHLIADEQKKLMNLIHSNPDYYVYKAQQDFTEKITSLAHKQLKEKAIIDAIAYAEQIEVTEQEILYYLNLLKRPRTKEFIYFTLPETRINEREMPISHEELYRTCLREKTLNYAINTLARYSS